jgi:hypothetical protein
MMYWSPPNITSGIFISPGFKGKTATLKISEHSLSDDGCDQDPFSAAVPEIRIGVVLS